MKNFSVKSRHLFTADDVVKCTIWLADEADFGIFNQAYSEFFPEDPPARSCIPSKLLLGAKVEIEAIAYKPV